MKLRKRKDIGGTDMIISDLDYFHSLNLQSSEILDFEGGSNTPEGSETFPSISNLGEGSETFPSISNLTKGSAPLSIGIFWDIRDFTKPT